jgi:DNA-binding CsgD family transcriptional regulator
VLLTPGQIMKRLDDAMRLLVGPPHAGVARHRSLREALDWGARTLAPREQILLRRLSAFAGPFTLDCAEEVCAGAGLSHHEVLPSLARLVAMSLVGCDPSGAQSRYWMLAIVRQYAGRLLAESGEEEAIQRTLACYAIACPEALSVADLLAAARRSTGQVADGLRLAAVAAPYWLLSGRVGDGATLLAAMLAQAEGADSAETPEHARALMAGGMLGCALGRTEDAARAAATAAAWCDRAGDGPGQLWAQALAGMASLAAAPHAAARLVADAERRLPGTSPWGLALTALHALALAEAGQLGEAHDVAARALAAADAAPLGLVKATTLLAAARVARKQGRLEAAQEALAAAEALATEPGAMGVRAVLLAESCRLALDRWPDGVPPASSRIEEAIALATETGSPLLLAAVLDVAGRSRLREGKPQSARSAFARVTALSRETGTVQAAAGILGLGQVALASGAASAAWTLIEEAHALAQAGSGPALHARTLQAVGDCAWALGDASRAWGAYHRALGLRVDAGLGVAAVESLESLACLAIEQDRAEYGARLLGAAEGLREAQGCARHGRADGRLVAAAASAEEALTSERYGELRSDGIRLSLSEAAAYACRQRGPRQRGVGWVSLTPVERQVADLAAAGMTNREIGQKLFSSPRTVQAHLSHVFAKLGISSRKMLAAEIASRNRQLPLHVPRASILA